ncbi:hypothetical protein GCM10009788_52830 [Nocardioides humi]|uniref:Uncharacterized protein n=1 Tax=Nocardioides humi TaxID=449461 RepID=A0ABN2BQD6_9ACTN
MGSPAMSGVIFARRVDRKSRTRSSFGLMAQAYERLLPGDRPCQNPASAYQWGRRGFQRNLPGPSVAFHD